MNTEVRGSVDIRNLLGSSRPVVAGGALLSGYLLLLLAGVAGSEWLFVASGGLVLASEWFARQVNASTTLRRIGFTPYHRHVARDASVLALLVSNGVAATTIGAAVLLMGMVWLGSIGTGAAHMLVKRTLLLPLETRNIDLSRLRYPAPPHPRLMAVAGDPVLYLNAVLLPSAVVAVLTGSGAPVIAGGLIAVAGVVVIALLIAPGVLRGWRAPSREVLLRSVRELVSPAPRVMLYFAGSGKDVYQVNMWLRTVEQLDEPAIVLLRERSCLAALAPTTLPVVCIPGAVETMNFGWDSVRVALHPSNVGKNIHILREPNMKHVFVGHGDSDKVASVNPYSKVYDEIWVAGRAGRDRYALADVGVRNEDIVEVGRPQLAAVRATGSAPDGPFTVLYAPTWEGWVDDPHATSLLLLGERIIQGLLTLGDPIRVWYKPHPLTGTRFKRAALINERLTALISRSGGTVGHCPDLRAAGNHVFTGPVPALYDCFNQADLLISDISSVVSDWLASCKPYAVGNTRNLPEQEFRRTYPTARAAYLISPDGTNLQKIVETVRIGAGDDPLAPERRSLKEYLLGADEPSAIDRFRAEVRRLAAEADRRTSMVAKHSVEV